MKSSHTSLHFVFLYMIYITLGGSGQIVAAQITVLDSFVATASSSIPCGIGVDPETGNLWVHGCSAPVIDSYTPAGGFLASIPHPGEPTNDADISFTPQEISFNQTTLPRGTLLFINGETDLTEIYAIDKVTGTVIDTLKTNFGNSHVVGGAYHPVRNSFFLIQDVIPGETDENRVAEIDPVSGNVLNTYQITNTFEVNFGDLEISSSTGNLFIVSNIQDSMAEYTPEGDFVAYHVLPAGPTALRGIALDCTSGEAWGVGSSITVFHMAGVPCALPTDVADELPASVHISSPYPNPFTAQATFSVKIQELQHVRMTVYDMLGRKVAGLHDGLLTPGLDHTFVFQGAEMVAGLYLLRVDARHYTETRRLVLVK